MPNLASGVVQLLSARGQTVATCESLTAGLCAATIASVPGASVALRGGLITYATELKHNLAGVSSATLAELGPVAEETARQMAKGARERCGADWGVALTGVAGPTEQDGNPVGRVWLAVAGPTGITSQECNYSGERDEIRAQAVDGALALLLSCLGEKIS